MSYSPRSPGAEEQQKKDDAAWEERIQQLVKLSNPRPRPLTPDATCSKAPVARFQKSCQWFKIPPYIRRDILRLALGDARLHLQLIHGYQEDTFAEPDRQGWRWRSSRCHRLSPDDITQGHAMTNGGLPGPWADGCHLKGAPIGVMGWLLSCRQNYSETIEILYSTNILILNGQAMMIHLHQLIPPQRLETVTSLEVRWYLKTRFTSWDDTMDKLDEDHLESVFNQLSSPYFPALRNLYITLEDSSQARLSINAMENYQEIIHKHLYNFSQRMSRLKQFSCALPSTFFEHIYQEATEEIRGRSAIEYESYRQVWRDSDGQMTVVRIPYVDNYPGPPHHILQNSNSGGFWILEIPDGD
ncbi:hypothetical protein FVEN_g7772 [Fusarium venenatum]|uniref:DUF7730 domain-containing protein n=1 Tax=Fusarium venenatum TaxID=56646 RepID=A0A2L2TAH7_9HYPO|nr:uncharacterized protein FVRRES_08031 [Fusarium venenatum]KAG8354302.1 hypothetical protein FVEN_g7772 [Fusarium venenatum]KAH6964818.1 hypothetical protein EDB82DRAFT_285618 [Fusarium venenatum]CEI67954.1 unnamed protein product [Fusarium venenatum]